jgi:hypothetical protein
VTLASHLKSSISSDASLFPPPPSTTSHNNNNTINNITQQQHLQQHQQHLQQHHTTTTTPSTTSHNNNTFNNINNTFNNITQQQQQHLQQHHGSSKTSELHCAKYRHCQHLKRTTHATVTHACVYTTCACYATYRFQQPPYPSSPFVENPDNRVMFAFEIENGMVQQVTRLTIKTTNK